MWMIELGYDPLYHRIKDKKIIVRGQVETQEQIDEWLKPNSGNKLKVTKPEVI